MHFQSKTLPQFHNQTGGRKKKPDVMVQRHRPLLLRIHGVCRHPPHVAMAKLNDMAVPGQRFVIASPRDVEDYVANTPPEGVPHVVVLANFFLACQLYPNMVQEAVHLVFDAAHVVYGLTSSFLDVTVTPQGDGSVTEPILVKSADNWHLVYGQEPFATRCCNYDYVLALVNNVCVGSLLNPFMTELYYLSKPGQTLVKDLIVRALVEQVPEKALPYIRQQLESLDASAYNLSPHRIRRIMDILQSPKHHTLDALGELRQYIVPTEKRPATPFGEAPFDRIAEKWDVDSYELRYLARVYEALLKNAQTTVLEDRYFSHRDQITSEGTRARPELTVNIKTT